MAMKILAGIFLVATAATLVAAADDDVCVSETNTYTVRVNLFAGELGYYTFDECPSMISPTIGIKIGETYTFTQSHRTNYYHPLGFSYYADGAHDGQDELEPGVAPYDTSSSCADTLSCPSPMYFRNGTYLGTYSNIPEVLDITQGEDNFGLDDYEPLFFRPLPEWAGFGGFEVKLRFDVEDFAKDIFYFCHIHQFMAGRIKLLQQDTLVQSKAHHPALPYEYDMPGDFDKQCGTYGLDNFQLPHPECPDLFVCDVPDDNKSLAQFSKCVEAMDCHMLVGMTTNSESESPTALFVHQMVPHHQNAVNMAKALLKTGKIVCDDLTTAEDGCIIETILREIINNQNFQIQVMYGIVEALGYPKEDDCTVLIGSNDTSDTVVTKGTAGPTASADNTNGGLTGILTIVLASLFMA